MTKLSGRAVLITGATGVLGRAVAKRFAASGAELLLTSNTAVTLEQFASELCETGARAECVSCDLSTEHASTQLASAARDLFGGLDVLINAAAVLGPIGLAGDGDWDAWKRALQVNLLAPVRLCQLFPGLARSTKQRRKIVNVSGGGATSARPRFSAYGASKTALVRFSETIALEYAEFGIDVNCIAPGIMKSRLTAAVIDAGPDQAGEREYEAALRVHEIESDTPERAAALALLLSSVESDLISGRLISAVWDDWENLPSRRDAISKSDNYTLRRVVNENHSRTSPDWRERTSLNVCVAGLWHLGPVTAACLASAGHHVIAFDPDPTVVAQLQSAQPLVAEPDLPSLLQEGLESGRLKLTADPRRALTDAEVLWVCWDTPVDHEDRAGVEGVLNQVEALFPFLRSGTLVLVSSQLPVGSIARLERRFAESNPQITISFAAIPENLRLGKALETFTSPARVVAGIRRPDDKKRIESLLSPFTTRIEWMSVESAEMTKHALNAFLATSVAFINEIATVCESVGADAADVARGLKSDERIGARAYLSPGTAFAGGTLARDVVLLGQVAERLAQPLHLISAVRESNEAHQQWAAQRLELMLGSVKGRTIAVWGLTYKPGTNTLRRSSAVALCQALLIQGATMRAFDPAVVRLPPEFDEAILLSASAIDAAQGADALVVATEWPAFLDISADQVVAAGVSRVLDASRFLESTLGADPRLQYVTVGSPTR